MKANELRIGNIIYGSLNFAPEIKNIHTVDFSTLGIISGEVDMEGKLIFEPIPINEEWLFKLGFRCSNDEFKCMFYNNEPNFYIERGPKSFLEFKYKIEIKHLHQLQNLYYSLTGEELKAND